MMQIGNPSPRPRASRPWPTWIALVAVWCAVLINQTWIFAGLMVAWAVYDLVTGESIFVQRVNRRDQPITYWVIVSSWIVLGVAWIVFAI